MRDSEQGLAFGFIPYPEFRTRGKKKVSDTDKIAIFYLSGFLLPVCTAYGQAEDVFANKTEQTEQTEQTEPTEETERAAKACSPSPGIEMPRTKSPLARNTLSNSRGKI